MDQVSIFARRNDYFQPMILNESPFVEILLHGKTCSKKPYFFETTTVNCPGSCIGNMKNRNINIFLYDTCNLMHCISADDNKIGAAAFKALSCLNKYLRR